MTLREFLQIHNLSQNAFGRVIGVRNGTVSRWVTGARIPSLKCMWAIQRATSGWVMMADFMIPGSALGGPGIPSGKDGATDAQSS